MNILIELICITQSMASSVQKRHGLGMRGALMALALIVFSPANAAADCNQSIAKLYKAKSPAVVRITALTINPYRKEDRVQLETGSGFIFDGIGLVMTNSHTVFGAQILSITLDDGTTLPVKLLGADPIYDLAILQIPAPKKGGLPVLKFADSDLVQPGDEVIAIGNPMGLGQTITSGIVSAINRILPDRPRMLAQPMIQTDTPINPGNSGGPILNRCGDVIGIASEILGNAQNIGFAIPSNLASSVIGSLIEKGRLIRPWLGIDGSMIDEELGKVFAFPLPNGFLVEAVEPNSPANLAGITGGHLPVKIGLRTLILGGDIIVAINDIEIKEVKDLQRGLDLLQIGKKIQFKIFRQGKIIISELMITERPLQPGDLPEASQIFTAPEGKGKIMVQ
jgi:S1-C subfamily serine protease